MAYTLTLRRKSLPIMQEEWTAVALSVGFSVQQAKITNPHTGERLEMPEVLVHCKDDLCGTWIRNRVVFHVPDMQTGLPLLRHLAGLLGADLLDDDGEIYT